LAILKLEHDVMRHRYLLAAAVALIAAFAYHSL
jgi:hypothetical protein